MKHKALTILLAVFLLAVMVVPASADGADDPEQAVWYRWYTSDPLPTTFEGTNTWTSGTQSGYMEYEVLYGPNCSGCTDHLIEVGTSLNGTTLYVYIATFDWSETAQAWVNFQWRWWNSYPSYRMYDTIWFKTTQLASNRYKVDIYNCTTSQMLVSYVYYADVHSSGIHVADNAMEYNYPGYNGHGTQAMQKIGGVYWGRYKWSRTGWIPGYEPYGKMHAYLECSGSAGCNGPTAISWLGRLLGRKVEYATDGVQGPTPSDKIPPPVVPASRTNQPDSTTFTSPLEYDHFVYIPVVTRCANAKQFFFHLWWTN